MDINKLVQEKREEILAICEKHGAYNVRVFGSVSRGEATDNSDVDFLVAVSESHSSWFPAGLVADLEDLLGTKVDVVTEGGIHWYIRDIILDEAREL